jgi:DNA polymerase-4
MDLELNRAEPLIMHVDLNSCFASIEQQANPLIRNCPVGVAAYDTPKGIILAASYDAKAKGVTVGVSVQEARQLCPGIIILKPDPDKYFDAHNRFKKVLLKYTNEITPKSVDEFVINFNGSTAFKNQIPLEEIGNRIKRDVKNSLGEYVTINVGIGANRFLAKLAAGLHKPDGLDKITAADLRNIYGNLKLIDLPGISYRYAARLNLAGIHSPLEFLDASLPKLQREVFAGINGFYWYLRLRGHEIDAIDFKRKSFGQQYALGHKTANEQELSRLLMKLCEKTGRRLRAAGYQAHGIHLWMTFMDRSYWSKRQRVHMPLYTTQDIFMASEHLLRTATVPFPVTHIGVTVYGLIPTTPYQLGLFNGRLDKYQLAAAIDKVNNCYGEFTLTPALMANMDDTIIKRVAFGQHSF